MRLGRSNHHSESRKSQEEDRPTKTYRQASSVRLASHKDDEETPSEEAGPSAEPFKLQENTPHISLTKIGLPAEDKEGDPFMSATQMGMPSSEHPINMSVEERSLSRPLFATGSAQVGYPDTEASVIHSLVAPEQMTQRRVSPKVRRDTPHQTTTTLDERSSITGVHSDPENLGIVEGSTQRGLPHQELLNESVLDSLSPRAISLDRGGLTPPPMVRLKPKESAPPPMNQVSAENVREATKRDLSRPSIKQDFVSSDVLIDKKTVVGRYEIIKKMGSGGFSVVYLAQDLKLSRRDVALKVISFDLKDDHELLQFFLREAQVLAHLNHPNIVTLLDADTLPNGQPFLVTEFLQGHTLSELIKERPLSISEALRVCRVICSALFDAHQRGIVHRDLKPQNIILHQPTPESQPTIKLIDFGIAKLQSNLLMSQRQEKNTQSIIGTLHYMSPEQHQDSSKVDQRTDVYALGIMLYEMLTGRVPFDGASFEEIAHKHIHDPLPRLQGLVHASVARSMDQLLFLMTHKSRRKRLQNMRDVKDRLDSILNQLQSLGLEESPSLEERVWRSGRQSSQPKIKLDPLHKIIVLSIACAFIALLVQYLLSVVFV